MTSALHPPTTSLAAMLPFQSPSLSIHRSKTSTSTTSGSSVFSRGRSSTIITDSLALRSLPHSMSLNSLSPNVSSPFFFLSISLCQRATVRNRFRSLSLRVGSADAAAATSASFQSCCTPIAPRSQIPVAAATVPVHLVTFMVFLLPSGRRRSLWCVRDLSLSTGCFFRLPRCLTPRAQRAAREGGVCWLNRARNRCDYVSDCVPASRSDLTASRGTPLLRSPPSVKSEGIRFNNRCCAEPPSCCSQRALRAAPSRPRARRRAATGFRGPGRSNR